MQTASEAASLMEYQRLEMELPAPMQQDPDEAYDRWRDQQDDNRRFDAARERAENQQDIAQEALSR